MAPPAGAEHDDGLHHPDLAERPVAGDRVGPRPGDHALRGDLRPRLGILGGTFVGVTMLDLGAVEYLRTTQSSLAMRHVVIGLVKSVAFGVVVALTGCYYGVRCGRSAAVVGQATTKAVVMGIVLVVVVDALFTVLMHAMRL